MRNNYDISKLNPRRNPYSKKLKSQVYPGDCVKKGSKQDIDGKRPASQ